MANELAQKEQQEEHKPLAADAAVSAQRGDASKSAQDQLEALKAMFAVALNSSDRGLVIFDADHRLAACNKRFAEMYAIPEDLTRQGTPFTELARYVPDKPAEANAPSASEPPGGETFSYELQLKNGQRVGVTRQPLPDGGWVEAHAYASDRRNAEQRIKWLDRQDPLTEVGDPLYFGEELENALQQLDRGIAFALHWIDIDKFREINKEYGQPVGYAVLKTVAERLVHAVRKGDLVARLGGDEFAVIQPGVKSQAQAEMLARRLIDAVSKPVNVLGHSIPVSVSIGVVVAPEHGTSSLELMKNIYLALYAAKAAGRHTLAVYNQQMAKE